MSGGQISCPSCGAKLRTASPLQPGKRVRCPKCHEPFTIPKLEPESQETVVEIDEDDQESAAQIDEDDQEQGKSARRQGLPFPTSAKIAAIIWLVFGGLLLVNAVVTLAFVGLLATAPQQGAPAGAGPKGAGRNPDVPGIAFAIGGCGSAVIALFAAAFLYVGVQTLRGTARDTLGNSIGSIAFGLLNICGGVVNFTANQALNGVVGLACGGALLLAGVLGLAVRGQYKDWRLAQKPLQK
jgi:hypothetical protein